MPQQVLQFLNKRRTYYFHKFVHFVYFYTYLYILYMTMKFIFIILGSVDIEYLKRRASNLTEQQRIVTLIIDEVYTAQ